jgi:phosphinothricin acetyltransferase
VIRTAEARDAQAIADIYNPYVADSGITFEEIPVAADEMARRIETTQSHSLPWLVAEDEGTVLGYAYANPWKARTAYRFAVEITVYVKQGCGKRGIGSALYTRLFELLRERGVHAIIGGIALPNDASVALHEKMGMTKVAHFRETGFKQGRWIDVGYWQLTL